MNTMKRGMGGGNYLNLSTFFVFYVMYIFFKMLVSVGEFYRILPMGSETSVHFRQVFYLADSIRFFYIKISAIQLGNRKLRK